MYRSKNKYTPYIYIYICGKETIHSETELITY